MQRNHERRWTPTARHGNDDLAEILKRDITSTNLPKLLRYEDRNSMAFSLETRLPFLDFRLLEAAFSYPLSYRYSHGWTKWLIRKAMSDRLPREVCWRKSKLGFPTPESEWLRHGASSIREILSGQAAQGVADYIKPSGGQAPSRVAGR